MNSINFNKHLYICTYIYIYMYVYLYLCFRITAVLFLRRSSRNEDRLRDLVLSESQTRAALEQQEACTWSWKRDRVAVKEFTLSLSSP